MNHSVIYVLVLWALDWGWIEQTLNSRRSPPETKVSLYLMLATSLCPSLNQLHPCLWDFTASHALTWSLTHWFELKRDCFQHEIKRYVKELIKVLRQYRIIILAHSIFWMCFLYNLYLHFSSYLLWKNLDPTQHIDHLTLLIKLEFEENPQLLMFALVSYPDYHLIHQYHLWLEIEGKVLGFVEEKLYRLLSHHLNCYKSILCHKQWTP